MRRPCEKPERTILKPTLFCVVFAPVAIQIRVAALRCTQLLEDCTVRYRQVVLHCIQYSVYAFFRNGKKTSSRKTSGAGIKRRGSNGTRCCPGDAPAQYFESVTGRSEPSIRSRAGSEEDCLRLYGFETCLARVQGFRLQTREGSPAVPCVPS